MILAASSLANVLASTSLTSLDLYGNRMEKRKATGRWELSRDGQFLLLHIEQNTDPSLSGGIKVVQINQLDDHGLVLEEVMKESETEEFFEVENRVFTFIR